MKKKTTKTTTTRTEIVYSPTDISALIAEDFKRQTGFHCTVEFDNFESASAYVSSTETTEE